MNPTRDPSGLLEAALAATSASREVLLRHHRAGPPEVLEKGDGSPVTAADREAERAVREVLRRRVPEIPVYGEEHGDDDEDADLTWVVDPIDGTISFVHGLPFFATLVALWDRAADEVLVGVLDLPALGETWSAAKGTGLLLDGVPTRPRPPVAGRVLVGTGDLAQFDAAGCAGDLDRLLRAHRYTRAYTDAFGHAQVLRGGLDVMVDPGLAPWDLLASRRLVAEAGLALVRRPTRGVAGKEDAILGRPGAVEETAALLGW